MKKYEKDTDQRHYTCRQMTCLSWNTLALSIRCVFLPFTLALFLSFSLSLVLYVLIDSYGHSTGIPVEAQRLPRVPRNRRLGRSASCSIRTRPNRSNPVTFSLFRLSMCFVHRRLRHFVVCRMLRVLVATSITHTHTAKKTAQLAGKKEGPPFVLYFTWLVSTDAYTHTHTPTPTYASQRPVIVDCRRFIK